MSKKYGAVLFYQDIAIEVGINAAIVYERIRYFCENAESNNAENHFHDGSWWTYNSAKAWSKQLPFLTKKQIETAIKVLLNKHLILTSNFNKSHYDRTLWYTCILPTGKIEIQCRENENHLQVTPIPNESSNESTDDCCKKQKTTTIKKNNEIQVAKELSSTEKFDMQFNKAYQEIKTFLKEKKYYNLSTKCSEIFKLFGSLADFKEQINSITNNKTFSEIKEISEQKKYIECAVRNILEGK